ncbi:MAG: hypothetical protein A2Y62_05255 [Candidatus Fischerbacteria bacterium RBG_13_37_8]|uniref:HD/PDEase domain-containing protein n=1 Tax=Candidatus Fischerbacteria bacterium RBG_13_37_8 TaxID=1817863 RepID=A0A1F5VIX3_9BACT|nr:MAG: hypothetical protein A2Y62_05255 [Candidatus Fischerbacteria bacterium RBG_13_37_8]
MSFIYDSIYEGEGLIGDPIHHYIVFTTPKRNNLKETTEKDLIDSDWIQRLRYIYQLQSSRWVYPSAEHSRFQHSVGTMHLASMFIRRLYISLKQAADDTPSFPLVEETLRIAALLHDVGHGPFGHFFEENYLHQFKISHEMMSQKIILEKLYDLILGISRSPSGVFKKNEQIIPEYCAFLIDNQTMRQTRKFPKWLSLLTPLFSGVYTLDNIDYVMRDSYMCGVAIGPVDVDRLLYYTFFSRKGLTLHAGGSSALTMFLIARLYLYANVYFHRTTRAIDLQLKEIFKKTIQLMNIGNPALNLNHYFKLTDWYLLEQVKDWKSSSDLQKKAVAKDWDNILRRKVKWKMVFDETLSIHPVISKPLISSSEEFEKTIRSYLPSHLQTIPLCVDYAAQDGRPLNPINMGKAQIFIFNPTTKHISKGPLNQLFEYIPAKIIKCRVFSTSYRYAKSISEASKKALQQYNIHTDLKRG